MYREILLVRARALRGQHARHSAEQALRREARAAVGARVRRHERLTAAGRGHVRRTGRLRRAPAPRRRTEALGRGLVEREHRAGAARGRGARDPVDDDGVDDDVRSAAREADPPELLAVVQREETDVDAGGRQARHGGSAAGRQCARVCMVCAHEHQGPAGDGLQARIAEARVEYGPQEHTSEKHVDK